MKTLSTLFMLNSLSILFSQDIIKLQFGGSLDSNNNFIEAFSFDFNRSEATDEETNITYSLCDYSCPWYFQPGSSIDLGGGIGSSANNVIGEFNFFRSNKGDTKTREKNGDTIRTFHQSRLDLAPTYESDKNFRERLLYQQVGFNYNPIRQKEIMVMKDSVKKQVTGISINPYAKFGLRNSRDFESWNFYAVSGIHLEWFYLVRHISNTYNMSTKEKYKLRISGDLLYVLSESDQFSGIDPVRYSAAAAFDYHFSDAFALGIEGKLGTITPLYETYNSIKLTAYFDPFEFVSNQNEKKKK